MNVLKFHKKLDFIFLIFGLRVSRKQTWTKYWIQLFYILILLSLLIRNVVYEVETSRTLTLHHCVGFIIDLLPITSCWIWTIIFQDEHENLIQLIVKFETKSKLSNLYNKKLKRRFCLALINLFVICPGIEFANLYKLYSAGFLGTKKLFYSGLFSRPLRNLQRIVECQVLFYLCYLWSRCEFLLNQIVSLEEPASETLQTNETGRKLLDLYSELWILNDAISSRFGINLLILMFSNLKGMPIMMTHMYWNIFIEDGRLNFYQFSVCFLYMLPIIFEWIPLLQECFAIESVNTNLRTFLETSYWKNRRCAFQKYRFYERTCNLEILVSAKGFFIFKKRIIVSVNTIQKAFNPPF